jgi:hypothetical protein
MTKRVARELFKHLTFHRRLFDWKSPTQVFGKLSWGRLAIRGPQQWSSFAALFHAARSAFCRKLVGRRELLRNAQVYVCRPFNGAALHSFELIEESSC